MLPPRAALIPCLLLLVLSLTLCSGQGNDSGSLMAPPRADQLLDAPVKYAPQPAGGGSVINAVPGPPAGAPLGICFADCVENLFVVTLFSAA